MNSKLKRILGKIARELRFSSFVLLVLALVLAWIIFAVFWFQQSKELFNG